MAMRSSDVVLQPCHVQTLALMAYYRTHIQTSEQHGQVDCANTAIIWPQPVNVGGQKQEECI
jgi:hypothetical protein